MKYLLDTNACIHFLRKKGNMHVKRRLTSHMTQDIVVSSIVIMELRFGATISSNQIAELFKVEQFLQPFTTITFDESCAERCAQIRADLHRLGTPIGSFDLLFAATALAHNLTLVTHNIAEFSRVPGLKFEDWEMP